MPSKDEPRSPAGEDGKEESDDEGDASPTSPTGEGQECSIAPQSSKPRSSKILHLDFKLADFDREVNDFDMQQRKAFLMNPLPKGAYLHCRVLRERTGLTKLHRRFVFQTASGLFLAMSKKRTANKTANYLISMDDSDMGREGSNYLGKVRSNFIGSEFVSYGEGENPKDILKGSPKHAKQSDEPAVREEMAGIRYSSWISKSKGPRNMIMVLPRVGDDGKRIPCKAVTPEVDGLFALCEHQSQMTASGKKKPLVTEFKNRMAIWDDDRKCFVLDFDDRVKEASVKNFQMIRADKNDTVFLQFGRYEQNVFNLDFGHPISPFQAFSIALTSMDYKICSA
eukprot:GEMP01017940.1.p1 GENE.GEMP01017940.1~~GEMP01017940.1.p1  ORF type:complete len:339 (+),score=88.72 GEMP01017940.1:82-1098(+)